MWVCISLNIINPMLFYSFPHDQYCIIVDCSYTLVCIVPWTGVPFRMYSHIMPWFLVIDFGSITLTRIKQYNVIWYSLEYQESTNIKWNQLFFLGLPHLLIYLFFLFCMWNFSVHYHSTECEWQNHAGFPAWVFLCTRAIRGHNVCVSSGGEYCGWQQGARF